MTTDTKINSVKIGIADLYDCEDQLIETQSELISKVISRDLAGALGEHLAQTEMHIERLDDVRALLTFAKLTHECAGIRLIIKEGRVLIAAAEKTDHLDATIITSTQRCSRFEISSYVSLIHDLTQMDKTKEATMLTETLVEEQATSKKLATLAKNI